MMPGRAVALSFVTLLTLMLPAFAQDADDAKKEKDETRRVEVRVTFSSGESAYIDKGRDAGLEIGDLVVFEDPSRGRIQAELAVVATTSSRATMLGGALPPDAGVRGEVIVPASREEPAAGVKPPGGKPGVGKETPPHPDWEGKVGKRTADQPLLVPSFHQPRTELPVEWRGRIFTHLLTNVDRSGDQDARYFLGRVGTDARANNLFGKGGLFRLSVEGEERRIDVSGGRKETHGSFRINRLSYEWGGGYDSPISMQIGRFLPRDTPELGLVDGLEAVCDVGFGRVGMDVGALPIPMPDRRSFDDVGGTLSWRYAAGEHDAFQTGIAFQQTWHKGQRDRSLILTKMSYAAGRDFSLFGSAWIDHYDSTDTVKSSGFQLTELHLDASCQLAEGHRARIGYSRIRWPEILRYEFSTIDPSFLLDNRVSRVDLSTYHDLAEHLRLDTRIGWWGDQDDDGLTGHLALRTPNLVADGLDLSATVFRTDGTTGNGYGLRLNARQSLATAFVSLGYEISKRKVDTLLAGSTDLTQHALFASVDWSFDRSVSLSVNVDYRFGDAQDALSLGVYIQYRF